MLGALHFLPNAKKGERISLELTRDQVRAAPEYKEDKPIVVLGASGNLEIPPRIRKPVTPEQQTVREIFSAPR